MQFAMSQKIKLVDQAVGRPYQGAFFLGTAVVEMLHPTGRTGNPSAQMPCGEGSCPFAAFEA